MISGLLPKLGIGVLGLGTAAASGYGVYELARTKSIFEILGRDHKVLKTKGDDDKTDWDNLVKKYKTATDSTNPKKISGLETSGVEENNLKSKCSELLKKSFIKVEDQDYIDAKNWCTDSRIRGK